MPKLFRVDPETFKSTISPPRRFKIASGALIGVLRYAVDNNEILYMDELEWKIGKPRHSFRFHHGSIVLDYGFHKIVIHMRRRGDEKDMYIGKID